MASVVQRIKEIKQPRGGYIHPKTLVQQQFSDGIALSVESLRPNIVGLTVDYLSRAHLPGVKIVDAFYISRLGAHIGGFTDQADFLLSQITNINNDNSIIAAAKLASYDGIYRAGFMCDYDPSLNVIPNSDDIINIRTMVYRTVRFFRNFEPITVDGFEFISDSKSKSGFTNTITAGDGDFLTADGLWDLKVLKDQPSSIHTLQLLVYHLMGLRSFNGDGTPLYGGNFHSVKHLGIFNPRLNTAYTIDISDIPKDIIRQVETLVIGYP